ncbi:hypothetical protein [Mycobacterium innocens]|nr:MULTISPECIES: hypothetical protein [Mycobacterium]
MTTLLAADALTVAPPAKWCCSGCSASSVIGALGMVVASTAV